GLLRQVIDAVVVIEAAGGHHALALRTDEPVRRADRDHDWSNIGRAHRPAAWRRRCHPADVSFLLHAEVDRLPPLIALVVVVAAGIEEKIAAESAHVAEEGSGHQPRGCCY